MKEILKAVQARLVERIDLPGFSVPLFDATGKLPPYAMLWTYYPSAGPESAVCGDEPRTMRLFVTGVAGTGLGVLNVLEEVESALTGGAPIARIVQDGWLIDIQAPKEAQPIRPDRNHTLETTNSHPFYGVVSYMLTIQRIGV